MANPDKKKRRRKLFIGLAVVALAMAIFAVLKNKHEETEYNYYAYYTGVKGLQASSPVEMKGVRIGSIEDVTLDDNGLVKVNIAIPRDLRLPDGTVALLVSNGVMGDKSIRLIPGTGEALVPDWGELPTAFDTSVMPASEQVTPYVETAKYYLKSADSTLTAINALVQGGFVRKLTYSLISFEASTREYAALGARYNKDCDTIANAIDGAHNAVSKLAAKNNSIDSTIKQADRKTANLATSGAIRENFASLHQNIRSLNRTVKGINNSDTGLGKYVNDKSTYNNATGRMEQTNASMQDLKDHPHGFSILGGKKKKKN